ncbi:MAG: response regulator transcription factor [Chloroflexi bacterium]|nr:response regulator transcription factor [Chloroflexota bacterium]MBV9598023.1 response regulator transcription factor [Chloroflexota bacterium]
MSQASGARILVVDDEPGILRAVQANLGHHDFHVDTAANGKEALSEYARVRPELVLLDLGLPDMDGLDIIRAIRNRANTPIVVLSSREAERDKVTALDSGADDYLTKPFGINELLARVRVALRHAAHPDTGTGAVMRFDDLEVDLERRRVVVSGNEVRLTPTEWDLVKLLASHPDKVLTDRMITEAVWGASYAAQAHSLHVYVARLRKKLQGASASRRYIVTEPGVGYRFVTEASDELTPIG